MEIFNIHIISLKNSPRRVSCQAMVDNPPPPPLIKKKIQFRSLDSIFLMQ
ncbi:hypothetical protein [Helicobacter cynogastricus]|nr:hypothetical protein [Helicobacter cynogastricus]